MNSAIGRMTGCPRLSSPAIPLHFRSWHYIWPCAAPYARHGATKLPRLCLEGWQLRRRPEPPRHDGSYSTWLRSRGRRARVTGADLRQAILVGATLTKGVLIRTQLQGASLSDADLIGANLGDADLSGAHSVTQERLGRAWRMRGGAHHRSVGGPMLVGYARTSTIERAAGLAAQRRDLKVTGCEKIFTAQVSSVAARAKLTTALEFVREGDVLVVTQPDRLGRSTRNLLDIVEDLETRGIALGFRWAASGSTQGARPGS
jgi:hypothetical protein